MKKSFKKILVLVSVLLLGILFIPNAVNAESNSSNYVEIDKYSYSLKGEDFTLSNVYFSKSTWNFDGLTSYGTLFGNMLNTSGRRLSVYMTINYYDENYIIVARSNKTEEPTDDGTYQMNVILYEDDFIGDATIDDIKYYKIEYYTSKGNYLAGNNSNFGSGISTPSQNSNYAYLDYVIGKYNVDIRVNENNTLDITETITAYFNKSKHGIIRTIPLVNNVTRLDGTNSKVRAQIKDLSVNDEFTKKRNGTNIRVQIGSASKTITGEKTYVIKYNYNLGKDASKDYDELYFNIIGTNWDTVIGNVTFSITMPKEFDTSKLGFSSGYKNSTDSSKIEYTLDGNVISGSYKGVLNSGEALTVRCELPEGYFVGAELTTDKIGYVMMFLPVLFLLVAVLLWYKYGKDEKVVETVEFYPPRGYNSLEVGFLYKGNAENKDVTSLLIYLANKGYIEITDKKIDLNADKIKLSSTSKESANEKIIELQTKIDNERKNNPSSKKIKYYENMLDIYENIDTPIDYEQYGLKSTINKSNRANKFLIKKLKDYDGNNIHEKLFMEGLFEYDRTEVTDKMLYNKFYITNNRILGSINSKQNKDKIFEKSATKKRWLFILMVIITYCLITIPPIFNYGVPETLIFALVFPGIGFSVMISMLFGETPIYEKIFGVVWGSLFGGGPWLMLVLPVLLQDMTYLKGYIFGIVCITGIIICLTYLPKRTEYGNEMLGKVKGFKNFLETVEKEKLEALVMENPNYFYDILPFTYVLGVSDKWIKKFETISMQAPTWYDSPNSFEVTSFGRFVNSTMSYAQSAMSSSPSSSSGGSSGGGGGGSSGGGSSGGGSGGGGGSSW